MASSDSLTPSDDREALARRIARRTRLVPVEQLQRDGTHFVRLVDPDTIAAVVADAVQVSLERQRGIADEQRQEIVRFARAEAGRLLQVHHDELAGRFSDEVERLRRELAEVRLREERAREAGGERALERDVSRLQVALERAQGRLDDERQGDPPPARLHFSDQAIEELGRRTRQVVARMAGTGELVAPSGDPIGWRQGVEALSREVGRAATRTLEAERQRYRREHERGRQERVERWVTRVEALRRALRDRSRQLVQLRGARILDDPWGGGETSGRPERVAG